MNFLKRALDSAVILAAVTILLGTSSLFAQGGFLSFDAPGAGTGIEEGTFVAGINSQGVIAGWYVDDSSVAHGFLRQPDGNFIEFTPTNLSHLLVYGINDTEQIVGKGTLTAPPYTQVGFIRGSDGEITEFSVPGSSNLAPTAINNKGEVTGYYFGSDSHWYSFVRDANSNITSFSDPNETTATGNGTFAWAINDSGDVAGYYNYNNISGINRGYIRNQNGGFTNFEAVPGGSTIMEPLGINSSGEVTGYYGNAETLITQCFVRNATGTITDFSIPGSSASIAVAINDSGTVVGYWQVQGQLFVDSFVRNAAGNITTFFSPTNNYGTYASGINRNGLIAGYWQDSTGFVFHGFMHN